DGCHLQSTEVCGREDLCRDADLSSQLALHGYRVVDRGLQLAPRLLGLAGTIPTLSAAVHPEDLLFRSAGRVIRQLLPDGELVVACRKRHGSRLRLAPVAARVGRTPRAVEGAPPVGGPPSIRQVPLAGPSNLKP